MDNQEQRPGSAGTPSPILQQIDYIVYLMLENRSLDNVLGWLYADGAPKNLIPPLPHGPQYDGLREGAYNLPIKPYSWSPVTYYGILRGVNEDGTTVPNLDPYEEYSHVMNQLFGDAEHNVKEAPRDDRPAAMQGFLQDFDGWETWNQALQMTETYTATELPVLYALAKQYAVSDRWYSSVPTQTNPNRAFALCGTSLGRLVNTWDAVEQFQTRTIWNALPPKRDSIGIFYHEEWKDKKCYTHYTFPFIDKVHPEYRTIVQINDRDKGFWARAQKGTLPDFSYIEPKWGGGFSYETSVQGNDYHPPTDVKCGEKLLYDVYTALSSNKEKWPRTLLIVTFDEHGGTYDHHGPPWGATNPGDPYSHNERAFSLFGVRVPTLLISPCVEPSTVFRSPTTTPYDHTSILATLLRWKGIDPSDPTAAGLWSRVAAAPTFEGVLRPTPVNPGIALPDPGPCVSASEADPILEGIPAAAKRYIAMRARSVDAVRRMAEDWRAHEATQRDQP